jgi:hypothetical protein
MSHRELNKQGYNFTRTNPLKFIGSQADWAAASITALTAEEIINGFSDQTFKGSNSILKQDLGIMLLRTKAKL